MTLPFLPEPPDDSPVRGDRFLVPGRDDALTVDVVELRVTDTNRPTVWLVRTRSGERWSLRLRDGADDGVWYQGTALPTAPE